MNLFKLFLIFMSITAFAKVNHFSWQGNLYKKIKDYEKVHSQFTKKVCTPGIDFKYKKLLKNYRSQGHYLPVVGLDIDRDAIRKNLHFFPKKLKHIENIKKKLKKKKKLPNFDKISSGLESNLKQLLKYKKQFMQAKTEKEKSQIKLRSTASIILLKKQFNSFMNDIYFMKSFNYPNDHLSNRFSFENQKGNSAESSKKRANRIFFYRKLVEDGAYEKNNSRGDLYTRTTLDTIYHNLSKDKDFISENVRHDLEWALRVVRRFVARGYRAQLSRINEWYKRTKEKQKFYTDIIQSKNKKKARSIVKKKNKASSALKEFTYKKQAEVYHFWKDKSRINKALFSLETILYNEVGTVDEPDGLEREDVAHIVMNRVLHKKYSKLANFQPLVRELNIKKDLWINEKWLNTLFRVGEFSFTYHYISSSSKIFCPDMSRRGKALRKRNLKIALKALKNPRSDFNVFRYFSRISMLGKIDMTTVWKDYEAVAERAGYEVENQKELRQKFKNDDFEFFYEFNDPQNRNFKVVRMNKIIYAVANRRGKAVFYKYRNPHLFKYFSKK